MVGLILTIAREFTCRSDFPPLAAEREGRVRGEPLSYCFISDLLNQRHYNRPNLGKRRWGDGADHRPPDEPQQAARGEHRPPSVFICVHLWL